MTELRFGIQGSGQLVGGLPDPGYFADVARLAETAGFHSIWAGDHVSFENPILDVTVALTTFEGRFTHFDGVSIEPLPAQSGGPPLWVGGRSAAALRTAGRLGDGWLPIWISTEHYATSWSEIRRYAEDAGRDPDALTAAAVVPALVDDDGERARTLAQKHLEERYATSFSSHAIERYCLAGTPAECAARARQYAEAGVRHLVFNPVVAPDRLLEQVERLAEAVVAVAA